MIKILIIALVIYLLVVTRARIRLPHPGLQATVDVLKAADRAMTRCNGWPRSMSGIATHRTG
ncbi:MAG: hypothetical protein ACLR8Y_15165 [Alistipes indistinctus]